MKSSPSLICAVIVPVLNSAKFLAECIESVTAQVDFPLHQIELIIFNDGSTDNSLQIARSYETSLSSTLGRYLVLDSGREPSGAGSARNRCCEAARSDIFIFLDSDDVMRPTRIARTVQALMDGENFSVVGGNFDRIPPGSTPRYERYHKSLTTEHAVSLVYAFRDTPLAMPTVACARGAWKAVGGFREGRGIPEDFHFLYDIIERGFRIKKLGGDCLTGYRYHEHMVSHTYHRKMLMQIRVAAFERIILSRPRWRDGFSVWNAGRDGKEFYKLLSPQAQERLVQWGDVDPRKIGQKLRGKPVVHFSQLKPPIVLCVAMDRGGEFEANLKTLELKGGVDYFHLV